MKHILITGFEPFGGETINPSWELVKKFNNKIYGDYKIISKKLPTVYYESSKLLKEYLDEFNPTIVFCFGQAGGSKSIRIERVAVNLNDTTVPDNKGNQPIDEAIIDNGENALFSTLPVRTLYNTLKSKDIPVSLSLSAGTYVCNHIFYHLVYNLKNGIGGFIHIPYIPSQVENKTDAFSLELTILEEALDIIINTTIEDLE